MRMNPGRSFAKLGISLAGAVLLAACISTPTTTSTDRRAEIQHMRAETLAELYQTDPPARARIQQSTGYAVFSNVGVNVILLSAMGGSGVARDNRTGQDTYMKMISGGIGLGLGVKDFRGVFVFTTRRMRPPSLPEKAAP
jgi:lipid-binding SYLF domain-containing protein